MEEPRIPEDEVERLKALRRYRVLDTEAEAAFDEIAALAARICQCPVGLISLVDQERQWFKARVGLGVQETPRSVSFCGHTINGCGLFEVPDARADPRFRDNPLVTGDPGVRSYTGSPLVTPGSHRIGTLCVIDYQSRRLNNEQRHALGALSRQVVCLLEMRASLKELAEARGDALQAVRAKDSFIANMSHELRTPLNGVLGYAQILLREPELTEKQRKGLKVIRSSGEHLLGLINRILDLAKIDAGEVEATEGILDLRRLLRNLSVTFKKRTWQKRVAFVQNFSSGLPAEVSGDEAKLELVLARLLSNAVKYTSEGEVTLEVKKGEGDAVRFAVQDTGPGIPEAERERVFLPFERLEREGEGGGGTGLGLAISRRLVRLQGGELELECPPGGGCIFHFTLDLPPAAGQGAGTGSREMAAGGSGTHRGAGAPAGGGGAAKRIEEVGQSRLFQPPPPETDHRPPPPERVAALLKLANRGDVVRLVQDARALAREEPSAGDFLRTVVAHAEAFRMRELKQLLSRHHQG